MSRKVIYSGSFDPFTLGHLSMVLQVLVEMNAEQPTDLIVAVGNNEAKEPLLGDNRTRANLVAKELGNILKNIDIYTLSPILNDEEKEKLKMIVEERPDAVQVWAFDGMLIDFALAQKADYILRGYRTDEDWQEEDKLAFYNNLLLETRMPKKKAKIQFLLKKQEHNDLFYVSSSAVKKLCNLGNFTAAFLLVNEVAQQAMARTYLRNCLLQRRALWGKGFMEMETLLNNLLVEEADNGFVTPVDCILALEYLDRYTANHKVDNLILMERAIVFSLDTAQSLIDEQNDAEDLRPFVKILRRSLMDDIDLGRLSDDEEVAADVFRARMTQPKLCFEFFRRSANSLSPDEFRRFVAQWTGSCWCFFTDYFANIWTDTMRDNLNKLA